MSGAQTRTVQSGEVRLAVVEDGDPDRPAVVFLHGYPDAKEVWSPVRARLAGQFHTVAYDIRGAGESSAPQSVAAYDFDCLGDDLVAVLDAVAPGKAVHLVGHDWGGLQGWEFATSTRFDGRLASFTAIAGPSLDQVIEGGRSLLARGRVIEYLTRARRSWYILMLLTPGVPRLAWRGALSEERWRRLLVEREGIPPEAVYPHPTIASDGIHGANLYRRNMPRRMLRPRRDAVAHVPVQLIIPAHDRYIPEGYYEQAEHHARLAHRHRVEGGHWVPLTHPDQVAGWIRAFVDEVEGERRRAA